MPGHDAETDRGQFEQSQPSSWTNKKPTGYCTGYRNGRSPASACIRAGRTTCSWCGWSRNRDGKARNRATINSWGSINPLRVSGLCVTFPYGTLHLREKAAWLLSRELGWPLAPPTVVRDGPHGEGSVQLFIDSDPRANFFTMRDKDLDRFAPIAMFDVLIQNADRKGGSCLSGTDGRLWAIDHGLTFNPLARQRTVMLEFCGRAFPEDELASLSKLSDGFQSGDGVYGQLAELLECPGDRVVDRTGRPDACPKARFRSWTRT